MRIEVPAGGLCLGLLALVALGCPRAPTPPPQARPVAVVDGDPILALDLRREVWRVHGPPTAGDSGRLVVAASLLEQLVEQHILARAARAANITVPAREVQAAWDAAQDGYRAEDFGAAVYAQMQTPERLKALLEERLLVERFLLEKTRSIPRATDEAVRRHYEARKDQYKVAETVRARQVVVRTMEEARILLDRLNHGEDFAKLAREHSVAPEKDRGGDLGFFARGVMPAVFDRVCFTLEPGQVSDVVTSEYGQHIFQVTEKRPEVMQPLEAVDAEIRDTLRRAEVQATEDRVIAELVHKAVVHKDAEALAWAADQAVVLDGGGRG